MFGPDSKAKELRLKIVSGSVVLLSGAGLATAINFAYNMAVARFLGPDGFGNATALYTLLTLTSAVTLAFQITTAKLVARAGSLEEKVLCYRQLHRGAWFAGVGVCSILSVFEHGVARYLKLPDTHLVALLALGVAFYVPLGTRRGYIQGAYGFRRLATNLVLEGAFRLVASVLMIVLGFGVMGVIIANSLAIAAAYFALGTRIEKSVTRYHAATGVYREIAHSMLFFCGQVLINNCDIVLVKHYFDPQTAGIYAAIAMVGRVTFACSSAVVNSMFPVVAGAEAGDRQNLSLVGVSLLMVAGVGVVIAGALRLTPTGFWVRAFGAGFVVTGTYNLSFLLAFYAVATVVYSLSVVLMTYEMSHRIANTIWLQLAISGTIVLGIMHYHASLYQVIYVQFLLMTGMLVLVALPLLRQLLRATSLPGSVNRTLTRTTRLVRRITEDEAIAEFLRGEFNNAAYSKYQKLFYALVTCPKLDDEEENAKRRALLFLRHRALWKELPKDVVWYEASFDADNVDQIRVFPRAHWRKLAKGDFSVRRVLRRFEGGAGGIDPEFFTKIENIRTSMNTPASVLGSVLLIGVSESEPLTVLDGNHRLVAALLEGKADRLRFICGLSPHMTECCWYRTDLKTLTRYGRNLVRQLVRIGDSDLKSIARG